MTRIAVYAPLKSPDHATPSGDREIVRGLMMALTRAGFEAELASDLRILDIGGDRSLQARLMGETQALVPNLVDRGRDAGWSLWLTYHNYYKAPDLLGPAVAGELKIPYVQVESTRARKRLDGPWARFAQALVGAFLLASLGAPAALTVASLLVVYNVFHLRLRSWGLSAGLATGLSVASALAGARFGRKSERIATAGVLLSGMLCGVLLERSLVLPGPSVGWIAAGAALLGTGFLVGERLRRLAPALLLLILIIGVIASSGPASALGLTGLEGCAVEGGGVT